MRDAEAILGLIQERGKKRLPLERVYKLLYNKDLYLKAYGKIYRNKGAMTHGVTDETPDGMSLEKIDAIIEALRHERYQWLPARRTYIPKKNGKKRPLGMPAWSDKLLQEVIRNILEAYYEPQFSDRSHGFRPERGCHTALREIYYNWAGTTWFIEGDISHCFDRLDHELLIKTLEEQIHDGRFINLISELLDAGYMEDWTLNQTLSGVPQGGVISPILSNILLDKLDKFVETILIPRYSKGKERRESLLYRSLLNKSIRQRRKGNVKEAEELRKQFQQIPSKDAYDPDFRRLKYVRYADDFLLGFIGPKSEAEEIKKQLEEFLREELKLELSKPKTLITHSRSDAARFLGYEVTTLQENSRLAAHKGKKRRSINGGIGLRVPRDVIKDKCESYKKRGRTIHRSELVDESDFHIITTYQLEYRGLVNYYRLAFNMTQLTNVRWVMERSLTQTLAFKHKMSVPQVYGKYGAKAKVDGKMKTVLQASIPRKDKEPLVARWSALSLKWDMKATLEDKPPVVYGKRTELEQRLLASICELCGNTENVEVHHVRAMKQLHEHPGRPKPPWMVRMIARRRKTMPLCQMCHDDVHAGRPLRRKMIELEEVLAKQKQVIKALQELE